MNNKIYAGIGARDTPSEIRELMTKIASKLEVDGYMLRSGGAVGADTAFELGVLNNKKIFKACDATPQSRVHASNYHSRYNSLSDHVKNLHARNSMIILGDDLRTPASFVVCWTRDGRKVGGTGLALRIASHYNIEIFNLHSQVVMNRYIDYVDSNKPDLF